MPEIPAILSASGGIFAADDSARSYVDPLGNSSGSTAEQRNRAKVLVVDDQKLIADTLVEILGNAGFDAVAAYDGFDALTKASRFHPQWVLTDVLMPRMNGVELAIAMTKNFPQAVVLLFSGQAGISEILQEGHRQGYQFELIAKPIHPLKLIERLKQN